MNDQARTTLPAPRLLRPWLLLVATGLAAACGGSQKDGEADPETSAKKPNVILITLDTVRADYLTCYGATTGSTPAIDGLASEGTIFERAVSSSGLTPASHATILTGKFQYNHGVRVLSADSGFKLEDEHETLATKFKEAGYRTAAVHSAFPVSATFGFDRGFDHFDSFTASLEAKPGRDKVSWDVQTFQRRSDETTERTVSWLDEAVGDAAQQDQPFFLWIHYWDPHDPVKLPPGDSWGPLMNSPELKDIADRQTREYAGEVRWQDQNIGTLLTALRTKGLLDNTVMAVTADHGQGLEDGMELHRWSNHRMLYREQVHVPLILRGPGVPAGQRLTDQVRTADVAPTLLDLAGISPIDGRIDGESLVPRIEGQSGGDLWAYGEQINGYDFNAGMWKHRPDATFLFMVTDGEWKLIYKPSMPNMSELFHVGIDPKEVRNVIGEHPEQVERLLANLSERNPWVTEPFPMTEMSSEADGGKSDILISLGYSAADKGTGNWWWTCPRHTEVHSDKRQRCPEEGCDRILIPMVQWEEPAPK
ncbi:Arylsulfatase [Planctomycetes bacterium Poly30]|uniref:Arylsulfatase n=1 Tax=Saltatorellus ferox TaxID=2528018 RepID=A0A518ETJ6_9BACT|nr:Arylsulfatase [Planctomycetes bacterium Poly30]